MQATSGFALDELRTEPWMPEPGENAVVTDAFSRRQPTLVTSLADQMPELAARLGAPSALLFPLARGRERAGLLAVGFREAPESGALHGDAAELADGFLTTLELYRFRQNDELVRELRVLIDEFTASLATTLDIAGGLEIFCHGASRLFGAEHTSVWVHDRRARQLVLQGCSDPERQIVDTAISADDGASPAVAAHATARAPRS